MGIEEPRRRQHRRADRDDALAYWLEQERGGDLSRQEAPLAVNPEGLPGGWWLIPAALLSVPLWALILWAIFAG